MWCRHNFTVLYYRPPPPLTAALPYVFFPFGSSNVLDPPVTSSCERPRGVNAMKMCAFSCGLEGFFLSFFLYLILSIFFSFSFLYFPIKKKCLCLIARFLFETIETREAEEKKVKGWCCRCGFTGKEGKMGGFFHYFFPPFLFYFYFFF
ncbi:hypothetical protein, unlikely [Trypanosoma congolense IL3000]|uniref:Uncharacterized protein n=1 Tax=Trypanosoma congolense (strain IL3000) TaxID=1068625 RepID=F9WBK0_TRYCI|nr:hypothetical protein, unlikely [Trypanosoma congolense IL3000]